LTAHSEVPKAANAVEVVEIGFASAPRDSRKIVVRIDDGPFWIGDIAVDFVAAFLRRQHAMPPSVRGRTTADSWATANCLGDADGCTHHHNREDEQREYAERAPTQQGPECH